MENNTSLIDEMKVSLTTTEEQSDESGIACAVVCCCAIATLCAFGCLLSER